MDEEAPIIRFESPIAIYRQDGAMLQAHIQDNVKVEKAIFYYRMAGQSEWKKKDMLFISGETYQSRLASFELEVGTMEYYIEASDGSNHSFYGSDEKPYHFEVMEGSKEEDSEQGSEGEKTEEDFLTLTIPFCEFARKDSFELPICLSKNPGIASLQFKVQYDSVLFEIQDVIPGNLAQGAYIDYQDDSQTPEGCCEILISKNINMIGSGTLCTLKVQIKEKEDNAGTYPFSLSCEKENFCDQNHKNIPVNLQNGEVALRILGDLYPDGKLNVHDLLKLQQYMAEFISFTQIEMQCADLDGDSLISMKDLVALANRLLHKDWTAEDRKADVTKQGISATPFALTDGEDHNLSGDGEKQYENRILLGDGNLKDGSVFIPVTFRSFQPTAAFKFKVFYDKEQYIVDRIEPICQDLTANFVVNLEGEQPIITWYHRENVTLDGEMFRIYLKARQGSSAQKNSKITLTYEKADLCDENLREIPATIEEGNVSVTTQGSEEKEDTQGSNEGAGDSGSSESPNGNSNGNVNGGLSENKSIKVSSIKISGLSHKIAAGRKISLKISILPENASNQMVQYVSSNPKVASVKATKGANKKLNWTSSNVRYATVSAGVVHFTRAGKGKRVKITAMATDGSGKKASIRLKIP